MKHYLYLLIACLCLVNVMQAQNPNLKWGKPSQSEWSFVAWGEAPDAEAAVLCKTMNATYQISRQFASYSNVDTEISLSNIDFLGNNDNHIVTASFENKLRIKILKDTGGRFANLDIIYYNEENDAKSYDEVDHLKVTVFSRNEKGKVARRNLHSEKFAEDRVDAFYKVLHIQVPDVKKGDIIEYQFTITSARIAYMYECSFQEEIPVLYAKCDMDIPAFLQFDMKVPVHPFIKSKVERGIVYGEQPLGEMKAPRNYPSNHYIIEGHDILPRELDLQRRASQDSSAKVFSSPALVKSLARIKNRNVASPVLMPEGKAHIMINPN